MAPNEQGPNPWTARPPEDKPANQITDAQVEEVIAATFLTGFEKKSAESQMQYRKIVKNTTPERFEEWKWANNGEFNTAQRNALEAVRNDPEAHAALLKTKAPSEPAR